MSEALDFTAAALALLDNALDEARAGHATRVEVEVTPETVTVRDDGRGLPIHAHPQSGRPLLEVILTGPRRGPRNTLARLNAGCLWLEVTIEREGGRWRQRYDMALPAGAIARTGDATGRGTCLVCAPGAGTPPSLALLEQRARARGAAAAQVRLRTPQGERRLGG